MMFYVESPHWSKPANKKCEEIVEFVFKYGRTIIADEESLERMIEEIRAKVEELNKAYPRTKEVVVRMGITKEYIICHPEPRTSDSDAIFTLAFHKVAHLYGFENGFDMKGGEQ